MIDYFRKSAIIFQRGLAQGYYDAKNRFAISLTRDEKSLTQSASVKKTDLSLIPTLKFKIIIIFHCSSNERLAIRLTFDRFSKNSSTRVFCVIILLHVKVLIAVSVFIVLHNRIVKYHNFLAECLIFTRNRGFDQQFSS